MLKPSPKIGRKEKGSIFCLSSVLGVPTMIRCTVIFTCQQQSRNCCQLNSKMPLFTRCIWISRCYQYDKYASQNQRNMVFTPWERRLFLGHTWVPGYSDYLEERKHVSGGRGGRETFSCTPICILSTQIPYPLQIYYPLSIHFTMDGRKIFFLIVKTQMLRGPTWQ